MDDVNLQLVREFFELHVFRVLTNWQQDPRHLRADNSGQFFAENVNAGSGFARDLPFVLGLMDISAIERAVVEVRAWHADRFYPSVIESSPVLAQFVAEDSLALAHELFGEQQFTTILVVSELPVSPELRNRSIDLLRAAGIEHVIEFPVILQGLLNKISINGVYRASQTLQTLRLLKRYKLIRNQQMEFPFSTEPPAMPPARIETTESSGPGEDED